jgi:hypothetical protein
MTSVAGLSDMTRGFDTHTRGGGANSIQKWNKRTIGISLYLLLIRLFFSFLSLLPWTRTVYVYVVVVVLLVFVSIQAERNENEAER